MIYSAILLALTLVFCDIGTANYLPPQTDSPDGIQISQRDYPLVYTELIDSIPDYYQRDMAFGGFTRGGAVFCGPTSVSNSLMWLYHKGHSRILESTGNPALDQHALITLLATPQYFKVGSGGTGPSQISSGLKRFFENRKIRNVRIQHHGWRNVSPEFRTGRQIPDLKALKEGLHTNDAVFLNYGWYRYDASKNEYTRTGGHWVTLVGYGHNGKENDFSTLIVHDPETRTRVNDYIQVEQIKDGRLIGSMNGLPRNASRYYKFNMSSRKIGIIDGAIFLKMPPIQKQPDLTQK